MSPGVTPLPRLTEDEYNNTIDDLFPALEIGHLSVPGDEMVGPFDANTLASVGDVIASQYQHNAESVSQRVAASLAQIVSCASTSAAEVYRGEAETIGGATR